MHSRLAAGRRLALTVVVLAVVGVGSSEAELVDRIVAIIDRDVVMLSEAEQAKWLVEVRTGVDADLRGVVERLIEARLIDREVARFTGEAVPDELVEEQLERTRSSFGSVGAFRAKLAERGVREEELRAEVRRQLAVNRYLERRFRALTYVTDEEIEIYFSEEILPELSGDRGPTLAEVDQIRRILEERRFNERVEQWIEGLKERARIRRYVW